jgi:hypothetical protein
VNSQQKARARRLAAQAERRRQPRHRRPSPVLTTAGGPEGAIPLSQDFIPTYRRGGEKYLLRRTVDYIPPGPGEKARLWAKQPRPKAGTVIVNGNSDRTRRHSPGRTLRPNQGSSGAQLAAGAIDKYFDGRRIPSEPPKRPASLAAQERSMSRAGYRSVGRAA